MSSVQPAPGTLARPRTPVRVVTAAALFDSLATFVSGEPVYLDVPEVNAWAMSLARIRQMRDVFGCARMYLGREPRLEESRIYGVTTFELG